VDPNGIQHITIFIALCEGFLGIMPRWDLWRYFFTAELRKERMLDQTEAPLPMGCVSIHLRGGGQAREYIPTRLSALSRGWCSQWLNLKNIASPALPGLALLEFSAM
jgi:hypothetical protein